MTHHAQERQIFLSVRGTKKRQARHASTGNLPGARRSGTLGEHVSPGGPPFAVPGIKRSATGETGLPEGRILSTFIRMKHFQRFGCWPDTVKVRLSVWECSGIAGPLRWATANGPKPQHRKLQPETRGTETRANRALRRIPAQK